MSIEYYATFGVGYEVDLSEIEDGQYHVEKLIKSYGLEDKIECCTYGGEYTDLEDYHYIIVLKNPFELGIDGFDIKQGKDLIDGFLGDVEIDSISEFGSVGGLEVF